MEYLIYENREYICGLYSICDVLDYINRLGLNIMYEEEDTDDNIVKIYCEEL